MVEQAVPQLALHLEVLSIGLPQNYARAKRVEKRGISIFWLRQVLETHFLLALVPAIAQLSLPTGWQIVGFAGQDGDEMDQLAFIYAPK
jgi:hypothetical protein